MLGQTTRPTLSGIYAIVNSVNGKRYIGSAVNLRERQYRHFFTLARGRHSNGFLQAAWNKYGAAAFTFRPLLFCSKFDLILYEQRCFDGLRPEYNLSPTAGSPLGSRRSAEQRERLRHRRRAVYTPEIGAKISAAKRGRKFTAEHKAAMSAARIGKKLSADHRAKIGDALRGRSVSEEQKAKLSIAARTRTGPHCWLGRKHTAETRAKMSASAKIREQKKRGERK